MTQFTTQVCRAITKEQNRRGLASWVQLCADIGLDYEAYLTDAVFHNRHHAAVLRLWREIPGFPALWPEAERRRIKAHVRKSSAVAYAHDALAKQYQRRKQYMRAASHASNFASPHPQPACGWA